MLQAIWSSKKTTLAGIGMILGALAEVTKSLSEGKTPDYIADITLLIGGIGLILGKDFNVTGTGKKG